MQLACGNKDCRAGIRNECLRGSFSLYGIV